MRMIDFIVFSGKVKILSISKTNHKKIMENYIIVNASFFLKLLLILMPVISNYSNVILRLINELTKIVAKISLVLVSVSEAFKVLFFMIY
jgi:hypothetical protein